MRTHRAPAHCDWRRHREARVGRAARRRSSVAQDCAARFRRTGDARLPRTLAPGTPGALVIYEDARSCRFLQSTRVPLTLMTTRRFARQLVEWGINADAVAALEEVAKTSLPKHRCSARSIPRPRLTSACCRNRTEPHDDRAPTFALRPFLIEDTPLLAEIFRASIEELAADDYSESQREAWTSAAEDEEELARRLSRPAHVDRHPERLAGRLRVARQQRDDRSASTCIRPRPGRAPAPC